MTVVGIVLAAGRGTRMGGGPKQLLPVDGIPLLQHVLDAAAAGGLADLVVVLGHEATAVAAGVRLPDGARVVVNPHHDRGQASSLRAGLLAAPPAATAALVLLGDQPEVRAGAVAAVIAAGCDAARPVARAAHRGVPGHPVLLHRSLWGDLAEGRGDAGARSLIAARGVRPRLVEVGGPAPADVDTPEDLERLRRRTSR